MLAMTVYGRPIRAASARCVRPAHVGSDAERTDRRRVSNGEQFLAATRAALGHPVSRQWKGDWQRGAT